MRADDEVEIMLAVELFYNVRACQPHERRLGQFSELTREPCEPTYGVSQDDKAREGETQEVCSKRDAGTLRTNRTVRFTHRR